MKKILIVSNMFPSVINPQFGTFVKNTYTSLDDLGFDLDKIVIDKKCGSFVSKFLSYILFYFKIFFIVLTRKYNYIYIHFVSHCALPLIVLHILGIRPVIVSHVHGGDVKLLSGRSGYFFKIKKILSSKILSISHSIIFPSSSYADEIMNSYQVDNENIFVYPSGGVDTALFSYSDVKRRHKTLGYAGRLIKSKNVDVIIESMVHLENYNLEIVGDGSEVDKLKLLAEKLNISDRVLFLPPKSQKELSDWYKTIHALIYPSSSESLGLVPIEAMSCGAHVVLSHIPAFNELSDIGFNVQIMPSISADSIVTSLMHTENLSDSERKSNSFLVDKLFAADKVKEVLLNVFK